MVAKQNHHPSGILSRRHIQGKYDGIRRFLHLISSMGKISESIPVCAPIIRDSQGNGKPRNEIPVPMGNHA